MLLLIQQGINIFVLYTPHLGTSLSQGRLELDSGSLHYPVSVMSTTTFENNNPRNEQPLRPNQLSLLPLPEVLLWNSDTSWCDHIQDINKQLTAEFWEGGQLLVPYC